MALAQEGVGESVELQKLSHDASVVLLWKMLTGAEFFSVADAMATIRHQATSDELEALRYLAGPGFFFL